MSLPSESQVLQLFQGTGQQQYTIKRLIQHFTVAVEERPAFRDAIRAMVARGELVLLHGTRYALPQRLDTLAGVVRRHAEGYGFVVPDDEQEDDVDQRDQVELQIVRTLDAQLHEAASRRLEHRQLSADCGHSREAGMIGPSVWRIARRKTASSVSAVVIANAE